MQKCMDKYLVMQNRWKASALGVKNIPNQLTTQNNQEKNHCAGKGKNKNLAPMINKKNPAEH